MLKHFKKGLAFYNRSRSRLICLILAAVMVISVIPLSLFNIFADDGGFTLGLSWQGTSNKTNYVYNSVEDESQLVRLRINYRNESPSRGYNANELIISVNGLGKVQRSGLATPVAIAADKASVTDKKYDWSYTYSSSTDTYTFTNNVVIPAANTLDGMFEIIWKLASRDTINGYSTTLSAKMRTAYNEQTESGTIKYSQVRTGDVYTVKQTPAKLSSAEGLIEALPEGADKDDYKWVRYDISGTDTYKSLDVQGSERFDLWYLPGTIVQSPDYTITKTGKTKTFDGDTNVYEGYSVVKNINNKTGNPYLPRIYVAYPKDPYDTEKVNSYVQIMGTYFESTEEVELAVNKLNIDLTNYGYVDIPGNVYDVIKTSTGVQSDYVKNHCKSCASSGAVNSDHLSGAKEYSSDLKLILNYRERQADYYDLEFNDDFIDMELKDGSIKLLEDEEYNFTKVKIAGANDLKNINGVPLASDTYPVEVYIRRVGAEKLETTPISTTKLTKTAQTIAVPNDTVGVRVVIRGVKESIVWSTVVTVYYKFHITNPNIDTANGRVYNNMYFNIYNEDGWANTEFDHNPDTYDTDREYQRDLDTYGHTYDREYGSLHVLEIPNEYRVTNTIVNTENDKYNSYFNGSITTTFKYADPGTVSKFSQYTILPETLSLTENITNEKLLLSSISFSANGISDAYIRSHCTAEIIENYHDSGRTYIALHYDFSDSPKYLTTLTASKIPMYVSKSDVDNINKAFTMWAATQVESGTGKWYTRYTDDNDLEDGLWKDITQDGKISDDVDFSSKDITIYKDLSSMLRAVKLVSTSTAPAFATPIKNEETGEYEDEDEIPTEYGKRNYKYSLTFAAGAGGAKSIKFGDVLESKGEWKGTFVSIDCRQAARILGHVPTVYYSSAAEAIDPEPNFSSGGWTKTKPATVKSIGIDFGDGLLEEGREISVTLTMKAPDNSDNALDGKLAENNFISHYTPIDAATGLPLSRTKLPSNDVPVKLIPYMGTIRLEKSDENDGRAIAGAMFDLYRQIGSSPDPDTDTLVNEDYETASNGTFTTEKLIYGKYYFVETEAALGYKLPENEADRIFAVTLESEEPEAIVTVKVENERKPGQFTLKKVNDRDETIVVEGAEFSVFTEDGTLVQQGLKTDDEGILTVDGLEWGSYYMLETKAPDGYELYKSKIPFTVSNTNDAGATLSATIKDPQKPASAVLTKYEMLEDGETETEVPLDGAAYALYRVTDDGDKLIGTYMTDDDGKIYADDLIFGDYYFLETIPAEGYTKYEDEIPFTVTPEHTTAHCAIRTTDTRIPGSVWLQKVDEEDAIVKGAVYGLYIKATDQLITSADFAYGDETKGLFTTNDEGVIEIEGLKWNEYYFKETKAPQGYELSTETYPLVINRQSVNNTIIIRATDTRGTGTVKLVKVSEVDEDVTLQGAEFSLYKSNGSLVKSGITTNDQGIAIVDNLAWGSYYFSETKAPAGYGLNPNKIRFSVNFLTSGKTQEIKVTDPEATFSLEVTKRIATKDIVFSHGDPSFTFKLQGTDNSRVMYKTVTFNPEYYEIHKNDEYLEQTIIFTDLLMGKYNVCEMDTQRYVLNNIIDISESGSLSGGGKSVNFNLVDYESGSATFVNKKTTQELTTHTSQTTNVLSKAAKLTAITAVWRGGSVTSDTINRRKLDVYAIYDDGSSVKLADDAYTLDPPYFDKSNDSDVTITVEYTEGSITRVDYFQIALYNEVQFTWQVLSDEPYSYDGKDYDGTVYIDGYTGSSSVVSFPKEVKGLRTLDINGTTYDLDDDEVTFVDNGKTYRVVQLGNDSDECEYFYYYNEETGFEYDVDNFFGNIYGICGYYNKQEIEPNVTQIILPEGIKKIGAYAFNSQILTGELNIPSSVTSIGEAAFADTKFTGELKLPDGLITIGNAAFSYCEGFTGQLKIPASVTSIGNSAFAGNRGFTGELVLPDNLTSIGEYSFYSCQGLTGNLVIPNKVTSIGQLAFDYCTGLNGTLTLDNSLETIDQLAFANCKNFTGDLIIPDSVTTIKDSAFFKCTGFSSLTLGDELTTIGNATFSGCSGFTGSLTLGDKVTTIGKSAFYGCSGFNGTLTLGDKVTTIGESAFSECSGFTGNLVLPNSLTTIGLKAFFKCSGFTGNLTLSNQLNVIPNNAFNSCGFTGQLVIPDSVKTIDAFAFRACAGFTGDLVIPNNVTKISGAAFDECSGFNGTLTIGNKVKEIGAMAFSKCGFIGDLIIPDSVTSSIGSSIFSGNKFDGDLYIGDGVPSIGSTAFTNVPFKGDLYIGNSVTSIPDDMFKYKGFKGTLTLGEKITSIGSYAFKSVKFTGNLVLPNGIKSIGDSAFRDSNKFTGDLILPDTITTISAGAFANCNGFDGILKLPDGLTEIASQAFYYCAGLNGTLTIPDSVTKIKDRAFMMCSGFTGDLTISDNVTIIDYDAFRYDGFNGELTIGNGVTAIGESAFAQTQFVGNLTLGNKITSIGESAFNSCGFTGTLTIPDSVTKIGNTAFNWCSSLTGEITVPNSVTSIGNNAFGFMNGITKLKLPIKFSPNKYGAPSTVTVEYY